MVQQCQAVAGLRFVSSVAVVTAYYRKIGQQVSCRFPSLASLDGYPSYP